MNICVECKHYYHFSAPRLRTRDDCLHPSHRKGGADSVTGIPKKGWPRCEDINTDGNCQLYEAEA